MVRVRKSRTITAVAAAALLFIATARADGDLSAFNAAVENAAAHQRVAIGYLRTGNLDLAAVEIEKLGTAWQTVTDRFAARRPAALKDNPLYGTTMLDVSLRIVAASMLTDAGRAEAARESLQSVRQRLADMRKASGVAVLADCILDANTAMDALHPDRENRPDLSKPETAADVSAKARDYSDILKRCDGMAPDKVRQDPEFRRLLDGALASLALLPKALEARDGDLLFRILIELRSFDHLLAFRYG